MTISSAFFSSLLNVSTSKIPNSDTPFAKIKYPSTRTHSIHFHPIRSVADSISTVDSQPAAASSSAPSSSATTTNSVSLDDDSVFNDDELKKAESIIGAKVRIKVPLKVYHVPKVPEYELTGKVGVVKQYVGVHKGKKISANLPYKVELVVDEVLGRDGKPLKFLAHMRDDEFEFLD